MAVVAENVLVLHISLIPEMDTTFAYFSSFDLAYLKDNLDKYMAQFAKVRVLHLKERHGLIRARLVGAEIAQGKSSCVLLANWQWLFSCDALC